MLKAALASAAVLVFSLIGAVPARAQTAPTVTASVIGASSITWTWSLTTGATGYRVLSIWPGVAVSTNISGDLPAATNSYTQVGLSTEVVYAVIVEAFGSGPPAFTVDSATNTALTAAAQPSGTMLLGTNNNSVSLSWVTDGNVSTGTTYVVNWTTSTGLGIQFSTNPFVNVANGSATATISALPGGQTINFDVQAVNSSGVASGYDVIVTTVIPALVNQPTISSATFSTGISSITWYWTPSTGAIAYQLFSATNGAVSPILSSTTLTYTQTGLATNTAYTDYIFAFDVPTSTASSPYTQYTLAAPTTALTLLGLSVPPSTATPTELLSWGANGNPVGTNYNILWWTNLTSTVTFSSATTSAQVPNLYGGSTVYFTVQAVNFQGSTTAYDSTYYLPTFGSGVPSLAVNQSTFVALGTQILPVGYAGMVTFVVPNSAGNGSGVISVTVASGTFTVPVTLTVSTPAANPPFPAVGGSVTDLPNPIHLTISAFDALGNPQQPIYPVILTVNYAASNFGSNQTTLDLARFDTVHQVWIPLATAKRGATLVAATDHLSSFAVLSVAAASSLSAITVGPNPLRPLSNPGAVMTFRNLPAGCRVRIFTYLGENVVDMIADGSGTVAWNGRNHVGSLVASGVYLAVLEGAGTKRTLRVAIER
jgi:hypothetical protein